MIKAKNVERVYPPRSMRPASGSYKKLKRSWACDAATFDNFNNVSIPN